MKKVLSMFAMAAFLFSVNVNAQEVAKQEKKTPTKTEKKAAKKEAKSSCTSEKKASCCAAKKTETKA